ncbi:PREDICTED: probable G-protein coupled receptor 179 [Pygoscelis adeliae]|uniref:probable G-protein coupled receptor 179 n=1 Tax=Pygoscelis adeliae TaxID=9238 RepID=UPI0004F4DB00|nr:PREDICTED: probable G-protein coupled receptor 179 [Pygoscelis adeliae]
MRLTYKTWRIQASGVILLETILFGSLLLYFPVFILYFKPSIFRCIVLRWVRMLGFAIVYGTITLKPHFDIGGHDRWDYMMVIAEMLFLLWGSFLCYATRAVPSAFHEPRYMGIALHNELTISAAFHVVRFIMVPSLHPDWTLLLFFAHTHGTITMTLALLFIPKFLHAGSPLREEIAAEVYEDELDMRRSGSCLNSSIASAWSEHSLDPDDIRSLVQQAVPAGDSPEPPADPLARAGEPERTPEGPVEEELGCASPPEGKGRLLTAGSISVQVCPWELVQEEILSRKQKAAEAADSGTPGDAAATPPSLKPPSQKTSFRGLGLAVKAFNHSRGKSILKGKREGEGSLSKSGGGQEEGEAQPGRDGEMVPCQHNNNAGTASEAEGWGYGREEAEGQQDSPAPGTGDGEKLAEEPSAPRGDVDAGRGPGPPSGVHKIPPSVGHQEGAEHPRETPAAASSGKAEIRPRQGAEAPVAELGKDAPAAIVRLITPKGGVAGPAEGLEGGSRSIRPQDHAEVEQPRAKPIASSPHPSTAGVWRAAAEKPGAEVCPRGAPGVPAGKGALLRQEAIASREDSGVPPGGESPTKVLEKGGSQPEPLGPRGSRGTERVPAKSQSMEAAPAAAGKAGSTAGRQAEVRPGETQTDCSIKIEICPWEESGGRALGKGGSEGDPGRPGEEPGTEKTPAKTPELPKAASETAGSAEGRTAEVCPWETAEGGSTVRAEICPWDVEGAEPEQERQEGERRWLAKWVKGIRPKSLGLLRAQDSGSSLQVPGWPWGSTGSEGPSPKPAPRSSELPEVTSRSPASARASVCPWEAAGADSDAEVCPWERGTALSDAGKLDDGEISQVKNGISLQRVVPRAMGETTPAADKGSGQRGTPSPGEGAEQPGTGLAAKHPALSKTSSKQAGTIDSKKADVCPWEVEDEPLPKTEICPWEEAAASSGKGRLSQDTRGTSKGENKPGSGGLEDIKAKLAEMGDRWPERRDTGIFAKLIGKSLESKKSQSAESIKEEVCPWESLGTEQPPAKPRTGSPALPKSPSRKSQSVESLKAEVCPWEAPELESTDKAEICPWETAVPPSGKEKLRQDKGVLSMVSKSPSTSQGLRKEIGDSTSAKKEKASRDRESICPWESTNTEGTSVGYGTKSAELLKATVKKWESMGSTKAEVCPWESLGTEQPPAKPRAGSPALPKSPSRKSQSVESLKVEVCPWEAPEVEAGGKEEICPWEAAAPPSDQPKAKEGPGGASKRDKRIRRQAALASPLRSLEKGSSEREAICPWESLGTEQPPAKPRTGSPALPKSPSRKSQSVESLKAEVCPWEAPELESTDKAEICPWETAVPPSGKEKLRQDKGVLSMVSRSPSTGQGLCKEIGDSTSAKKEKASRDRESICPWESTDTEQPPAKPHTGSPALPKSPSRKSQSVECLKVEVCPWEAPEVEAGGKAEICPWEAAAPLPEKGAAPGKVSLPPKKAGASEALEKGSSEREAICPWESLGTEEPSLKTAMGKEPPSKKSDSTESKKSDICPWEAAEPTGLEKESFKPGVRPQGADRAAPTGTGKSKPVAGASAVSPTALLKKSKGRSDGEAEHKPLCRILPGIQPPQGPRAEPLPRGASTAPAVGSSPSPGTSVAEVCPWEAEEAPPASDKTSTETGKTSEVCPWEVESADPTPTLRRQGRAGASPQDRGRGASETKPDVCPWDHE